MHAWTTHSPVIGFLEASASPCSVVASEELEKVLFTVRRGSVLRLVVGVVVRWQGLVWIRNAW